MSVSQQLIEDILTEKKAAPAQALKVFDSLETIPIEFMFGRWSGFEIATGHPLDGLFEPANWYGKIFFNAEEVHPLVHFGEEQRELYAVNPRYIPLEFDIPKSEYIGTFLNLSRLILETSSSKARLRNVEYRGRVSATMIYDEKPINDVFVKIDDDRVLGVMDLKGQELPFFFVLVRDDDSSYEIRVFEERDATFRSLFEMEVQNRAFALRSMGALAETASSEEDKHFYGSWTKFETLMQEKYAPYAQKYGFTQEPGTVAKLQAVFGTLAVNILPNSIAAGQMLEETTAYAEKLRELARVSPDDDRPFFSFVVKQEEMQIEALRLKHADKTVEAAEVIDRFIAEHKGVTFD
ncbi:MAG: DUF4334 domain-containing protein [Myxococcota bacterium]